MQAVLHHPTTSEPQGAGAADVARAVGSPRTGAAITSVVLNLPTLGEAYLVAVQAQDMFLAGSFLLIITALLIVGNIVADVLLAILDPRVTYE